jgi:hypothetical protein
MKIRALTIFITDPSKDKISFYADLLHKVNDEIIWTKRIAFPPEIDYEKIISYIPSYNDIIYSVLHLNSKGELNKVKDVLLTDTKFYASVLLKDASHIEKLSNFIYSLDADISTRFAILINDDFLVTPYFPVGSANTLVDSIALSLLYTSEFKEGKTEIAFDKANQYAKEISKKLKLRYLGVDISLSPWKEESVGNIVEERGGKIFSLLNVSAVHEINKEIFNASWTTKITPIGFSELMLPVAEDNTLMQRVSEGSLTLSQLLLLTSVCVAGVDMVAVRRDLETYKSLLKSTMAIQFIKRRPYGVRVIPSDGSGEIFLKEYGKIPEIKTI